MEPLIIEAKEDSPKINLDKLNNIFQISGNSFTDDPVPYYLPIIDWIEKYKLDPNKLTIFEFKLNYINTASSKQIANLLTKLEEARGMTDLTVKWYYHKDDEDMFDEGLALKTMIKINFELVKTD